MDVEDLVRAYLLADTAIATAVGNRIGPAPPPQGSLYPQITMQLISDVQSPHLRQRGPGLAEPRYQIDVWAMTKSELKSLASQVQHRLQGFTGHLVDTTVSPDVSHWIWIRYETGQDSYEGDVNRGYWRRSLDYFIGHQGTAA